MTAPAQAATTPPPASSPPAAAVHGEEPGGQSASTPAAPPPQTARDGVGGKEGRPSCYPGPPPPRCSLPADILREFAEDLMPSLMFATVHAERAWCSFAAERYTEAMREARAASSALASVEFEFSAVAAAAHSPTQLLWLQRQVDAVLDARRAVEGVCRSILFAVRR